MKIKLILAADPSDPLRKNDPFMPLSLPLLAACAPGHDYTLVDMLWEDDPRIDEPCDLVGISVRQSARECAFALADRFRERGVRVVVGGPHVSMIPYQAAQHADIVVVGEGEELWPQILDDVLSGHPARFYVCSPHPFDGKGETLIQRYSFPDMARIPVAHRGLYRRKYVFDTVFASRGCPVDCDFCCVTSLFGPQMRLRPVDAVVDEIATFKRYYYLLDDTVFGRPATWDYYLHLYDEICRRTARRYWTGQANLDAAREEKGREVIRRAVDAGLLYAAIGIESINPRTLEACGAHRKNGVRSGEELLDVMCSSIRFIQDRGVLLSGWFVIGYDSDSLQDYEATLAFCRTMHLVPAIFPVNPIEGTRLHARLTGAGRTGTSRLNPTSHPHMDDAQILAALRHIFARGYSPWALLARTLHLVPRFSRDRIHRTIFSLITQYKLKGGIDLYHAALPR